MTSKDVTAFIESQGEPKRYDPTKIDRDIREHHKKNYALTVKNTEKVRVQVNLKSQWSWNQV